MTTDTMTAPAPVTAADAIGVVATASETASAPTTSVPPTPPAPERQAPAKRASGRKTKTLELTLTVTGTADGEWRAELRQGTTFLAKDLAVAAAAVSRAAKELHEDLATPIEEARSQQAAKVAALEAELEAARRALADLD